MLITIKIRNPPSRLNGLLRRYLMRVDSTLYTGNINQRLLDEIKDASQKTDVKIIKANSKMPFGVELVCGQMIEQDFVTVDGIRLLKKR